ncbi:hypothetical protein L917_13110 [Phytophthora nicotianae]|uniref:Uncharacterized protein n=1 Tax=Phytophthora nicotianae TaxID=4792 RepID=W2KRH1_PHYNI|nr:hypothetical protein L917_13110 [Phytophthora nicotianae]
MDLQASPPAWRASFCACKTSLLQHRVVAPYCNKDSRSRCARVQFPVLSATTAIATCKLRAAMTRTPLPTWSLRVRSGRDQAKPSQLKLVLSGTRCARRTLKHTGQ